MMGYRQCYVFDNIFLHKYNVSLETFVVLLISYICRIVSVELKLLQVLCNRIVVLNPGGKKLIYSSRQKAPLKV